MLNNIKIIFNKVIKLFSIIINKSLICSDYFNCDNSIFREMLVNIINV